MIKGNKIEKKPKYGMRKLSLGLCSGILAFGMFFSSVGASRVAFAESRIGNGLTFGDIPLARIFGKVDAKVEGKSIVVYNLIEGNKIKIAISYDSGSTSSEIKIVEGGIKLSDSNLSGSSAVIKFNNKNNEIKLSYDKNSHKLTLSGFDSNSPAKIIDLFFEDGGHKSFKKLDFDNKEKPKVEIPKKEDKPEKPKVEVPKKEDK
ncbi:YSIRK-type signal peptide-containing protein, partial [Helcococcus ovis]|uniref:YSIRK-type signal peptide-containing protein n=2 Tax=Helcococcus ovis TaxID=72026 RepID=UPI0038B7B829